MIQRISEDEAKLITKNDTTWSVIIKEENNMTESAVCLKKIAKGYLLGVSCETTNFFELFFSKNYDEIYKMCEQHIKIMKETNYPYNSK